MDNFSLLTKKRLRVNQDRKKHDTLTNSWCPPGERCGA